MHMARCVKVGEVSIILPTNWGSLCLWGYAKLMLPHEWGRLAAEFKCFFLSAPAVSESMMVPRTEPTDFTLCMSRYTAVGWEFKMQAAPGDK
jgi:hypothetical protein